MTNLTLNVDKNTKECEAGEVHRQLFLFFALCFFMSFGVCVCVCVYSWVDGALLKGLT